MDGREQPAQEGREEDRIVKAAWGEARRFQAKRTLWVARMELVWCDATLVVVNIRLRNS